MGFNWPAERAVLIRHVDRLMLDTSVRRHCIAEITSAIARLQTHPQEGAALLRKIARELGPEQCHPVLDLIRRLEGARSPISDSNQLGKHEPWNVDLAIVCALREPEFERVRELLMDEYIISTDASGIPDTHFYHFGVFRRSDMIGTERRVLLAHQNQMGMVECAILSTKILLRWAPQYLAMTGVCGGRPGSSLKLGDLVIPSEVFTYRTGKVGKNGFEAEPHSVHLDGALLNRIREHADEIALLVWKEWPGPAVDLPSVRFEAMACADVVMDKKGAFHTQVTPYKRSAIAVDMESYSLLRAAELSGSKRTIPFVVKGVMDFTEGKTDEQKAFAAFASARFVYHLVLRYLEA